MTQAKTLGEIVGENLARLRESLGETQDRAAYRLRAHGLHWTRANVAALESGRRRSMDLEHIVLIAHAYDVTPLDLLESDDPIRLAPGVEMDPGDLEAFLGGSHEATVRYVDPADEPVVKFALEEWVPTDLERRLADRLGVGVVEVAQAAMAMWGRPVVAERDARADAVSGDPRAVRGHVTRELTEELRHGLEPMRDEAMEEERREAQSE